MNRTDGSCRGSWDTYGCLYTDPETWILQRSLRYKDAEIWAQRRGSCRGSILVDAETWIRRHESCRGSWDAKMLRLRRHGSCRGSWDINGCWEDPEIRRYWNMNPTTWTYTWIRRHGSCRGSWDTCGCYVMNRTHGFSRGSWDTYGCLYTDPETWIL